MTIDHWLRAAQARLEAAHIATARLDALVLLEDELQLDRSYLLAHPEAELAPTHVAALDAQLMRREQHEPLAYIRGFAEFYGRRFTVTPDVLVPRPESETIIELLLQLAPPGARLADIGTGSGCLAITAALETGAVACAVDIDEACLTVARRNAVLHTAAVTFVQGSLLEPFLQPIDPAPPEVLIANLPYVPVDYDVNEAARHEPALALFAGVDGLDLYRTLFAQVPQLAAAPDLILTESLPSQHDALAHLAASAGYRLQRSQDFIQAFVPVST